MQRRKTPKSVNKPPPIQAVPKKTAFDGDNDIQFELELCWCVQQLQTALDSGKLSQKIGKSHTKKVLNECLLFTIKLFLQSNSGGYGQKLKNLNKPNGASNQEAPGYEARSGRLPCEDAAGGEENAIGWVESETNKTTKQY